MDINKMDQGLLKRNPALTQEEFYTHWLTKHAPLVVPFFLHVGVTHYHQIHGPLIQTNPLSTISVDITNYDGAAGMPPQSVLDNPLPMARWVQAYYQEIILTDERRFLFSEALEHITRVPPGTVEGKTYVVIKDGKCEVEVSDEIWRVWRGYETRGIEEGKDQN